MKTRQQLYEFMNKYPLGVVSTVSQDGSPHSAIVGFGQTKNLEVLFATNSSSAKYKNLQIDQRVAFVVGGETPETIQFEGIARELTSDELDIVRQNYWKKNPHAKVHQSKPGERYFILKPVWIRYTNLSVEPWDVTEIRF